MLAVGTYPGPRRRSHLSAGGAGGGAKAVLGIPLSSAFGSYETVKSRCWSWLEGRVCTGTGWAWCGPVTYKTAKTRFKAGFLTFR